MKKNWTGRFGFAFCVTILLAPLGGCGEAPSPAPAAPLASQGLKASSRWLITYARPPGEEEERAVLALGAGVLRRWDRCAWVILATMDEEQAKAAREELAGVLAVERDGGGAGHIVQGPEQIGARRVIAEGFEGRMLRGEGQVIAIVDTGLDPSHPDIAGRIAGWVDLAGPDGVSPGAYAEPVDRVGHGTAVASAAAGSGAGSLPSGRVPFTGSSHLYPVNGYYAELELPIHSVEGEGLEVTLRPPPGGASSYRLTWLDGAQQVLREVEVPRAMTEVTLLPPEGAGGFTARRHRLRLAAAPAAQEARVHEDVELQVRTPYATRDGLPATLGVAPGARLYGVKALDDDNGFGSAEVILDMLTWLYDNAEAEGITVVNASLGFFQGGPNEAVDSAVNRLVSEIGVPFIASAGNTQGPGSAASPSTASLAIGVGAVNHEDALTNYSALGGLDWSVQKPDVLAPGGSEVRGRMVLADSSQEPCKWFDPGCARGEDTFTGDYLTWWGTSFAAPHVAGVVALLLEADGGLTYGDPAQAYGVSRALKIGAIETGDVGERVRPGLPGRSDAPWDVFEGWGRVDVSGALGALVERWPEGAAEASGALGGPGEPRVWARRVTLAPDAVLLWELSGPEAADLDLYVYAAEGSSPTPELLGGSTQPGLGGGEIAAVRTGAAPQEAILVVKAVAGGGAFTLRLLETSSSCDAAEVGVACAAGEGACRREGVTRCVEDAGAILCSAAPASPLAEVCGDGVDQDCDGASDEGFEGLGEPCEAGVGACRAGGTWSCDEGGAALRCEAELGAPGDELCGSGEDEDCDGAVDEGFEALGEPCEAQVEACINRGSLRCDAARTGLICSVGAPEPAAELCGNTLDEDCDGKIDEDWPELGAPCSVGQGACAAEGLWTCGITGRVALCDAAALTPTFESCDAAGDEDCDGKADEGCPSPAAEPEGCGCALPGRRGASPAGLAALLAGLGALMWRRRA